MIEIEDIIRDRKNAESFAGLVQLYRDEVFNAAKYAIAFKELYKHVKERYPEFEYDEKYWAAKAQCRIDERK